MGNDKFKTSCRISCPEALPDLAKHCREEEVIIMECYGYGKSYCPKTCSYSRGMTIKRENTSCAYSRSGRTSRIRGEER